MLLLSPPSPPTTPPRLHTTPRPTRRTEKGQRQAGRRGGGEAGSEATALIITLGLHYLTGELLCWRVFSAVAMAADLREARAGLRAACATPRAKLEGFLCVCVGPRSEVMTLARRGRVRVRARGPRVRIMA